MTIPNKFLRNPGLPPATYIDRDGEKISREKWELLRKDPGYCMVREYKNINDHVLAVWNGEIFDNDTDASFWKPFKLTVLETVMVADHAGLPKFEQVVNQTWTQTFSGEQELLEHYETYLVESGLAEWIPSRGGGNSAGDPDHHFLEKDNELAPAPDAVNVKDLADPSIVDSW